MIIQWTYGANNQDVLQFGQRSWNWSFGVPGFGRLEYTIPANRLEYTLDKEQLAYTLKGERLEFTAKES